jgi:acyl-CoA synthetase (AMP-forming)/AMP-acid ligase II
MPEARYATFRDAVAANAARAPDAPFVLAPEPDLVLTWQALAASCDAFAAAMEALGVRSGDVVGFMLPNGLSALTAFLGAMAGGYVVAPFNLIAQDSQLDYVLGHALPRVVFADADGADRLRAACARSGAATRIVEVGIDGLGLDAATPRERTSVSSDQPAMLMYTSGTTGAPKGVLLTHANMLHAGAMVARHQQLGTSDRVLSSLPLYHINGQCIATASTLISGGSMVMPHRFSTSQWWPLVERYRPTWLNVVPTIIAYLLNGPDLTAGQRDAVAGVKYARSASSPLPPEQQRAFESRFGISIVEAMGLTECASVAFCNPMDVAARRIGSPGQPLGVAARVVSREGRVLGDGEPGQIELKGPNVMREYFRASELTAQTLSSDGWLATGDLGYRDADGFYFITGRTKELIIKGGENIAPREIDEALLRHPAVLEAVAVGVPDRAYGQEIAAFVVRALPARAWPVQDAALPALRDRASERSLRQGTADEARGGVRRVNAPASRQPDVIRSDFHDFIRTLVGGLTQAPLYGELQTQTGHRSVRRCQKRTCSVGLSSMFATG